MYLLILPPNCRPCQQNQGAVSPEIRPVTAQWGPAAPASWSRGVSKSLQTSSSATVCAALASGSCASLSQCLLGQRALDTLGMCSNVERNKYEAEQSSPKERVLSDSLGRKPNCLDPDAATAGSKRGSKELEGKASAGLQTQALLGSPHSPSWLRCVVCSQGGIHSHTAGCTFYPQSAYFKLF